jgi:hypothetical protein
MLGLGSGTFDPETLVILETAFDEAWITLKSSGSSNIRPNELARRICHLAMEGERDPVRLHDRALGELIPANDGARIKLSKITTSPKCVIARAAGA